MQATARLIDHAFPSFKKSISRDITIVVISSILIAISSKLQIPALPVPFTMQSYVILTLSMALGFRLATFSVILYLLEGAIGLPVFAQGGGVAIFLGATGGYLIGFLLAAMAVGYLADKGFDKQLYLAVIAMLIGTAILFIPGVLWLAVLFGVSKALAVGLYPFWTGMIIKIILGTFTLPLAWKLIDKN